MTPTQAAPSTAVPTSLAPAATDAPLADGRYPVLLKHIDGPGKKVTVDVVQWLQGAAAVRAKKLDGIDPSEPPDFYVRNTNPGLRTLPVAAGLPISVNDMAASAGDSTNSTEDVRLTWAKFSTYNRYLRYALVWMTVRHDVVTRLAEQYLP